MEYIALYGLAQGFRCGSAGKDPPAMWETWVRSLGWEDPLEKEKVTHSSILAWRIPRTIHIPGGSQHVKDTAVQGILWQCSGVAKSGT